MDRKTLILSGTALAAIVIAAIWLYPPSSEPAQAVNSFEECAAAGYPVMESYPRRCRTPDDRTFTENAAISGGTDEYGCPADLSFENYPAGEVFRGIPAEADFATKPGSETFRSRIREAMSQGVNFAGHYVLAEWGCGTACQEYAVVDARTGAVVNYGELNSGSGADFRAQSKLLILNPPQNLPPIPGLYRQMTTDYYEMKDGEMEIICKRPALAGQGGTPPPGKNPGEFCIQVITPARNRATGEVRDFPTPCDVPAGWDPIR